MSSLNPKTTHSNNVVNILKGFELATEWSYSNSTFLPSREKVIRCGVGDANQPFVECASVQATAAKMLVGKKSGQEEERLSSYVSKVHLQNYRRNDLMLWSFRKHSIKCWTP